MRQRPAGAGCKVTFVLVTVAAPLLAPVVLASAAAAAGGDPTGAVTLVENPRAPVDYVWVLVAAFLVMFMQPGFAMLEAGFSRAKNVTSVLMKNIVDYAAGSLAFWAVGFALMLGASWHMLIGTSGFFLAGDAYDVSTILSWFFMLVFCATAATIVSGAIAERPKFSVYLVYSVVVSAIIFPIYGHWLWGGGWLSSAAATAPSTSQARASSMRSVATLRSQPAYFSGRGLAGMTRTATPDARAQRNPGGARHFHPLVRLVRL
ncbi:MAG: Ammonia channel protein AmtB [Candidatus Alkanophagales archaeon MCA70_species_1]|nr:Ammonia channel protein AmtB [Candidatus Alkanophaga volatiphilum]